MKTGHFLENCALRHCTKVVRSDELCSRNRKLKFTLFSK